MKLTTSFKIYEIEVRGPRFNEIEISSENAFNRDYFWTEGNL